MKRVFLASLFLIISATISFSNDIKSVNYQVKGMLQVNYLDSSICRYTRGKRFIWIHSKARIEYKVVPGYKSVGSMNCDIPIPIGTKSIIVHLEPSNSQLNGGRGANGKVLDFQINVKDTSLILLREKHKVKNGGPIEHKYQAAVRRNFTVRKHGRILRVSAIVHDGWNDSSGKDTQVRGTIGRLYIRFCKNRRHRKNCRK